MSSSRSSTLNTVVTPGDIGINERAGSVHSIEYDYRSSPITFEDYFYKSHIQRIFITNVLAFQIMLNLSPALGSLFCTFLTDQLWFWEAREDLLNALLLHTVILSTLMFLLPFLVYKLRKWNPSLKSRSVLEALVRLYQATLGTFWFAFGMGKIWRSQNSNAILDKSKNVPLFFLPATYYVLNLINHLVIVISLRFTNVSIQNRTAVWISLVVSTIFLILALPLALTCSIGRGFILWDALQVLAAAVLSALEGSLILCSLKKPAALK